MSQALAAHHELAAVDLGSNSFRLEIGRVTGNQIYRVDALREPVRIAAGLTKDKQLTREAQARGLATLERFGERLRGFSPAQVRAVATNTVRVARNAKEFLSQAEQRLGFPIEIIGGHEEARLIYFGVAHLLEPGTSRRFVIDIGGGSTELIVGTGYQPELIESVYVGCVGYSMRFFAGDLFEKAAFKEAELAARREFEVVSRSFRNRGWHEAIGSSGTARALADLLDANAFSDRDITADGLDRLKQAMLKAGKGSNLSLAALKPDRIPVLAGGLSIMAAAFAEFRIERMSVSDAALRTGVLYDLLGRANQEDMRAVTVREFMLRYQVDEAQGQRVSALASALWREASAREPGGGTESVRGKSAGADRLLEWAALLHEIGRSISHNGYHKHSAYILANADMPGFSKREQATLATIVLGHTGKLPKMRERIETDEEWRLVMCLRLAALFCRSRNDTALPPIEFAHERKGHVLRLPGKWLEANPLTEYELGEEVGEWRRVGRELVIARIDRG